MDAEDCPKSHPVELAVSFLLLVFIIWANHTFLDAKDVFITRNLFARAALVAIPFLMVWEPKYFTEYIPRIHHHKHTKLVGLTLLLLLSLISAIRLF